MKSFIADVPYLEKIKHKYDMEDIATMTSLFLEYSVAHYSKETWAHIENLSADLKRDIGIKSIGDFDDIREEDFILVPEEFAEFIKINQYSLAFRGGKAVIVVGD